MTYFSYQSCTSPSITSSEQRRSTSGPSGPNYTNALSSSYSNGPNSVEVETIRRHSESLVPLGSVLDSRASISLEQEGDDGDEEELGDVNELDQGRAKRPRR